MTGDEEYTYLCYIRNKLIDLNTSRLARGRYYDVDSISLKILNEIKKDNLNLNYTRYVYDIIFLNSYIYFVLESYKEKLEEVDITYSLQANVDNTSNLIFFVVDYYILKITDNLPPPPKSAI